MTIPVIIIGGGGHAKVLINTLLLNAVSVLGIVEADAQRVGEKVLDVPVIGSDEAVYHYKANAVRLVNGVGSIGDPHRRQLLFTQFKEKGYVFNTVIHPSAVIANDCILAEGVQVMAGAIVQPGTRIGQDVIVNTGTMIDHDCVIGDHAHLAPGVILSGNVHIGEGTHIGTGATVIQGVKIGAYAVIGAGSVILEDVPEKVTVVGVPGKVVQR